MARLGRFLTEQEVKRIVTLLASSDMTILEIAQRMTCSPSAIGAVNRRFQVRRYAGLRAKWILELKPEFPAPHKTAATSEQTTTPGINVTLLKETSEEF